MIGNETKKYKKYADESYLQQSDDCVSRQAVIDTVDNTIAKYIPTFIGRYERIPLELVRAINDVSPVTPTPKTGEWCKQNDDYFDWYECSVCGYGSGGEMQYSSEYDVRTKYCPNCGCRMIEVSE